MKKNLLRALFLSLLITIFVLIFNFSSQNGEESGSLSKMVTEKIESYINIETLWNIMMENMF